MGIEAFSVTEVVVPQVQRSALLIKLINENGRSRKRTAVFVSKFAAYINQVAGITSTSS